MRRFSKQASIPHESCWTLWDLFEFRKHSYLPYFNSMMFWSHLGQDFHAGLSQSSEVLLNVEGYRMQYQAWSRIKDEGLVSQRFGNRPDEDSVTSHSMDRGDPSAAGSAARMSSAAKWPPLAPALPCASNGVITKFARAPATHILIVGAFLLGAT